VDRTGCFALRCSGACATSSIRNRCAGPSPAPRRVRSRGGPPLSRQRNRRRAAQLDKKRPALTSRSPTPAQAHPPRRVYWPATTRRSSSRRSPNPTCCATSRRSPPSCSLTCHRPLTMIRTEGIAGERFYQKHWDPELASVREEDTIFSEHKDERHDYLLCDTSRRSFGLRNRERSNSTCGTRARSPVPTRRRRAPTIPPRSPALEGSISTIPTMCVRHRSPTSTRGRRRRATSPTQHRRFREGQEVASPCASCLRAWAWRRSSRPRARRPARLRADRAHTRLRRGAQGERDSGAASGALHRKRLTVEWSVPKPHRQDIQD